MASDGSGLDVAYSLFAFLAATFVFLMILRTLLFSSKGKTVVLVGPPNTGKTTLFLQLRHGDHTNGTVASMEENYDTCTINSPTGRKASTVKVVDVPGHPRLSFKQDQFLREAQAIIFVANSVGFANEKQEHAEVLYEVLVHPQVVRRRLPVLVACNKADLGTEAFSVEFIRKTLEKQLDTMRKTKAAALGATARGKTLGSIDKIFTFSQLKNKISFGSISAKTRNLVEVENFITTHV